MRVASLVVALVALPLLVPQPASACSKRSLWAPLRDRMVYFTGIATADTMLAGPGGVRPGVGGGHYGRAVERDIYGQVVAVDALGGAVAQGLPQGVEEVVVVPWDYDPACRPLPWGRSARWVPIGTGAFYIAELRTPEQWVDGRPTLDLHNPGHLPYTGAEPTRGMRSDTPIDSMLTPAQLFDLYRALPSAGEIEEEGAAALGSVREWIERNPELIRREPVRGLVGGVVRMADRVELSRGDHPVHGTWRFDIQLPDGSVRTVFGRSDPGSMDRWSPARIRTQWSPEQLLPPDPDGLQLMVTFADALDALPDTVQPRNYARGRIHTVSLSNPVVTDDASWPGWLDSSFLSAALGGHPVARQADRAGFERYRARSAAGLPEEMPATFMRGADGVLRVRQSYRLPGGAQVIVEGEQLSRQVLRSPG